MRKAFIIPLFTTLTAQTTVNPDISLIGDASTSYDGYDAELSSAGVEIVFQGYVNPFAQAEFIFHKMETPEAIEIEEGWLAFERVLPLGAGLKFGKMRPDFGKINTQHAHAFPHILIPEPVEGILGHVWSSLAVEGNILMPTPWYARTTLGYYQNPIGSDIHGHEEGHSEELENPQDEEGEEPSPALALYQTHFFDLNAVTFLELGAGYYQETATSRQVTVGAGKFRWRPNRYRSLTAQGEYFQVVDEEETIEIAYLWINYQFRKVWNMGLISDYSSHLEGGTYRSAGAFMGYSPVEETTVIRLGFHQPYEGQGQPALRLQVVWSLGPHKPHEF